MFRPMCRGPECIVLHGPPVKDVLDKVYQMGEKCVEFTTEVVPCPEDSKDVVKTKILTNSPSSTHRLEKVRIKLGIASLLVGIWGLTSALQSPARDPGVLQSPSTRSLNDNPFRNQL